MRVTITFIFDIIVTIKITDCYWFVIIFFLFRKIYNIINYFIFDWFSFFFNLKIFFMFLIITSFGLLSFSSLKRFVILLIMSFFNSFFIFYLPQIVFFHKKLFDGVPCFFNCSIFILSHKKS